MKEEDSDDFDLGCVVRDTRTFEDASMMFFCLANDMTEIEMRKIFHEHCVPDWTDSTKTYNHFWNKYNKVCNRDAVRFYFSLTPDNQSRLYWWSVEIRERMKLHFASQTEKEAS